MGVAVSRSIFQLPWYKIGRVGGKLAPTTVSEAYAAGDEKLGDGLEVTRKLWKERFGWDYQ